MCAQRQKTDHVGNNVKSLKNEARSFISFVNRSSRQVDVCWVDYKGNLVLYKTLSGGGMHHLNTFVTHPWLVKDHETGDRLTVGGADIYYPVAWAGDRQRTKVYIDIPVFTLTTRCLQVLRKIIPKEEYNRLEIPVLLKLELTHKQNLPCPLKYMQGQTPLFLPHQQAQGGDNQGEPQGEPQGGAGDGQ